VQETSESQPPVLPGNVEGAPVITESFEDHDMDVFATTTRVHAQRMYPPVLHESETQLDPELRNNDNKILSLLNQDTGYYYSFKGLMRKLRLHQQSLTRALNRLEQRGLITRSPNGYRLNLSEQHLSPSRDQDFHGKYSQGSFNLLLQTFIPKGITERDIIKALSGRWFGKLRWIGLAESEIGHSMHWTNEENSFQVNLKVVWDSVVIESNAVSNSDRAEAMIGCFKMFEQITKLLQITLQNKDPKKFLHGHFLS
jgi:MarR family